MALVEFTNAGSYKPTPRKLRADVERQVVKPEVLLGRHHRVQRDEKSGKEVHVFAIAGPPVFETGDDDDSANAYDFNINIPVGPVVFILTGTIDSSTLTIQATFKVQVPFFGTYTLGQIDGNLNTGVSLQFGISGIVSGTVKFYAKGGWLWMDLSATILGSKYGPLSVQLIPLP